jgi:SNF2 family DNA or RNA helicase
MKLIVAKPEDKDVPKVKRGAFVLYAQADHESDLRRLEGKNNLYIYINDEGFIGSVAALAKTPPPVTEGVDNFTSEYLFDIDTYPSFDNEDKTRLARETLRLRGSRISPTYMEVSKVQMLPEGNAAYVEGPIFHSIDPRLEYLDPEEQTVFGQGQFDVDNVKGHHSGRYVNLSFNPWAIDVDRLAIQQELLFNECEDLKASGGDKDQVKDLEKQIEKTKRLLKPHAYQPYKYENDRLFFINSKGCWEAVWLAGLRDIDLHDRNRIREILKNIPEDELEKQKHDLFKLHPLERFAADNMAVALEREVRRRNSKDEDEYSKLQERNETRSALDGPLGAADLPGLRSGVKFLPHQPYILASLTDNSRQLVDADPGAGKTLIIICDILHQMKEGKIKRPIIVMPEYLLPQFASEVKVFSELNPWIINTESCKHWLKTSDLSNEAVETFLEDAKNAPPNTVFLTSYNWLGQKKEDLPNGTIKVKQEAGQETKRYGTTTVYHRPNALLRILGVDALYMDECHVLKNDSDQVCATITMAKVPVVRGFTGTIMPGNLIDVTGPMGVIHSGVFGSTEEFLADYSANGTPNLYSATAPKRIREKLTKYGTPQVRCSAWMHLLPASKDNYHYVKFTPGQQDAYDMLLETAVKEIDRDPSLKAKLAKLEKQLQESGGEGDTLELTGPLLSKFTPLEVFLNSPAEAQKWLKPILTEKDSISPKAKIVSEICRMHLANRDNGKVLVFCQFKESAHGLLNALDADVKEHAAYYEGGMVDVLRQLMNPSDPLKIVVGVDRTLRTGHNLQSVNCIVHADLLWLNGDMKQRESRSIRPGQTRNVDIHFILTEGSSEILKMARLVSADHMVSKANSDFEDKHVLQPVAMTLASMQSFRQKTQLNPYIERRGEIKRQIVAQSSVDRQKFGEKLLAPQGSAPITATFDKAKMLSKVPSSRTFVGDAKNIEFLVAEELGKLPEEPKNPKLIELHLKKINDDWALVSYYTSDPQGWLRRLRFKLSRTMWCIETGTKAGALAVLDRIKEKNLDIVNEENLVSMIMSSRVLSSGARNTIPRTERTSRTHTRSAVAAAGKDVRGEVEIQYGMFDLRPMLWVDTLDEGDVELKALRSLGFRPEPAFWYLFTSRTQIVRFFTRLQQLYPDVRLTNWDDFKSKANLAFRAVDLTSFDALAAR